VEAVCSHPASVIFPCFREKYREISCFFGNTRPQSAAFPCLPAIFSPLEGNSEIHDRELSQNSSVTINLVGRDTLENLQSAVDLTGLTTAISRRNNT
jgi:hypothetical protein